MFNINDYVVYGQTGVCQITDIANDDYSDNEIKYYVLKPVYENNMTIKVPVKNENVQMRPIMSKDEVLTLIAAMPEKVTTWIDDTRQRSVNFKSALRSGNNDELVEIIRMLYLEKEARNAVGKKLAKTDEDMMNAAEKQLNQEFALALNISPDEVVSYILDHIPQIEESDDQSL